MTQSFDGFSDDFFRFFRELKKNNNRTWFQDNKARYKDVVQGELSAFVQAMQPKLAKVSAHMVADPRPNGGSIFRIYRDLRFAKGGNPYKEHGACQFRHEAGKDAHAPGFYVHLEPTKVFFGGGTWMPAPPALKRIREAIAENSKDWVKASTGKKITERFGGVHGGS